MSEEIPSPDPPLTPEQQARVAQLSDAEIQAIDETLLSNSSHQWRKVARVVGMTMMGYSVHLPSIPDIFYGQRVRKIVQDGRLESQGNLSVMRLSEVRLPGPFLSPNAT